MSFNTLDNYAAPAETCVAIGIFDGVHRGHQRVLSETNSSAKALGLLPIALTFDPHPAELLAPERAPAYICSLSQRMEWMTLPGLADEAVVARFDLEFARLGTREFVERVLIDALRARIVRVGADFRFGRNRQGSVMDLESMGERFGFGVDIVHAVSRAGERVSSTSIRSLIASGETEHAATLLGRPFEVRGTVVHGKHLGRTIGYPTINLQPEQPRQLLPANGIYAGYASVAGISKPVRAAISVGINPTTDQGDPIRKVEAFLMDGFDRDVYGAALDLRFAAKVRDEERFDSLERLVAQMGDDIIRIGKLVEQID